MKQDNYHHGDLKNALIDAGINILRQEGVRGLSLRNAAKQAGVSHSAPYAHFKDKQALIAAISTRGLQHLYQEVSRIAARYRAQPAAQLFEVAWAYTEFCINDTGLFNIIFSSILEREHDYPEFVDISHQNFALIVDVIENNQQARILRQGDPKLTAVSIWSMVHGFISLVLERQIPSSILREYSIKELLHKVLHQFINLENE